MSQIRNSCRWLGSGFVAVSLPLLPILVGLDYGGVLSWSQFVLALAICFLSALSVFVSKERPAPAQLRYLVPLGCWVAYAWWQTVSLNPEWVSVLSSATAVVYREWMWPLVAQTENSPTSIPLSLSPSDTRHAAAVATLLLPFMWAAGAILRDRLSLTIAFATVAIGVACHSLYLLVTTLVPGWSILPIGGLEAAGGGMFVNRNNFALHLNLGITAALAMLGGRLADRPAPSSWLSTSSVAWLLQDRLVVIAICCIGLSVAGLLACGSRAGMASMVIGLIGAVVIGRQTRLWGAPLLLGTVLILLLACISFGENAAGVKRISEFELRSDVSVRDDPRWPHWENGAKAAAAYLPAGAGLSSYAFAYLPYQEKESRAWFHHADNLWLELIVEFGIPGAVFAIFLIALFVRQTISAAKSTDGFKRGMAPAGWYCLLAVLFSQFFDFGLVVPANLFAFALLYVGFSGYSKSEVRFPQSARVPSESSERSSIRRSALGTTIGLATTLLGMTILPVLRADAMSQYHVAAIRSGLAAYRYELSRLEEISAIHCREPECELDPDLLIAVSDLKSQIARLSGLSGDRTSPEYAMQYRASSRSVLRRAWRENPGEVALSDASRGHYVQSLENARACLRLQPLSIDARARIVYLDFIHQDEGLTRNSLTQLAALQRHAPEQLETLAHWAANGNSWDLATKFLNRTLEIAPERVASVVDYSLQYSQISLSEVIGESSKLNELAATRLVYREPPENVPPGEVLSVLAHCVKFIDARQHSGLKARSQCHELSGRIYERLGKPQLAYIEYTHALELDPGDKSLRSNLITSLSKSGKIDQALKEARIASEKFPQYKIFSDMVRELSRRKLDEKNAN